MRGAASFPVVGRQPELRVIGEVLAGTAPGLRVVAVTGEPGIGKTTLAEAATAGAAAEGWQVGWGHALEHEAPLGWPWGDVLTQLGLDPIDIEQPRFERFRAAAGALRARSAHAPVLIVLDDVHDADEDALLLARFVANELRTDPVALILTARAGEPRNDERRRALLDQLLRSARNLPLGPLDGAGLDALARSRTDQPVDVSALHQLSGGNPLFAHHVLDLGLDAFAATRGVPSTTRSVLAERIRPLRSSSRRILGEAAELGENIDENLLARLTERTVEDIELAVEDGENDRLLHRDANGRRVFSHGLIRSALADDLRPGVKRALHIRARDWLAAAARTREELAPQVAFHACEAADTSDPRSVAVAVDWCRRAAQDTARRGETDRAEMLLRRAATLVSSVPEPGPRAAVLVEQAEISRMRGRLAEARSRFREAADAALAEHDDEALARAAIGRGGVWLREAHDPTELAAIRHLQESALARIQLRRPVQAARLEVRLAAERAYIRSDLTEVREAITRIRTYDDPVALAEALSLYHHLLMGPAHTHARTAIAEELAQVAAAANDEYHSLMAACWYAVDQACLGSQETDDAISAFRQRADASQMEALQYVADAMAVMQASRAGRLEEAEALAQSALSTGERVGDADALLFYGTQLMAIRWMQGRTAELVPTARHLLDSGTLGFTNPAVVAGYALFTAIGGDRQEAERALRQIRPLAGVPQYAGTLTMLYAACEAASVLGDASLAREALALIEPYADLPVRPSLAVTCFGSARRAAALCRRTLGDLDGAIDDLERAVAHSAALANAPLVAMTKADLADALAERGSPTDTARAASLFQAAIEEGVSLGLTQRVEQWRSRTSEHVTIGLERHESGWNLTASEQAASLPDLLGFTYLARIIAEPGEHDTWRLAAAPSAVRDTLQQPMLDRAAKDALGRRARAVQQEMDRADERGDASSSEALAAELEEIARTLSAGTNRHGRSRGFPTDHDRARSAVTKAINRAIEHVESVHTVAGASLRRAVHTGARCWFDPAAAAPVIWSVTLPPH